MVSRDFPLTNCRCGGLVCGLMRGYEVAYFQLYLVAPRRHTELLSYWSHSNPV